MFIVKKQVDLEWVAQETSRKYTYFDDLVWVALLLHAHIEEGSRFSVGGPRLLRKYINLGDLVWMALLFHAPIAEIS